MRERERNSGEEKKAFGPKSHSYSQCRWDSSNFQAQFLTPMSHPFDLIHQGIIKLLIDTLPSNLRFFSLQFCNFRPVELLLLINWSIFLQSLKLSCWVVANSVFVKIGFITCYCCSRKLGFVGCCCLRILCIVLNLWICFVTFSISYFENFKVLTMSCCVLLVLKLVNVIQKLICYLLFVRVAISSVTLALFLFCSI